MSNGNDGEIEVERKPSVAGWELFLAIDAEGERELWTIALKLTPSVDAIEYALWTDPKGDPEASGSLDPKTHPKTPWAARVRDALKGSRGKELDDTAREELILAVLAAHDPSLKEYESRLAFNLSPPDRQEESDQGDD